MWFLIIGNKLKHAGNITHGKDENILQQLCRVKFYKYTRVHLTQLITEYL